MNIRAVVFDVGGVLEVSTRTDWPGRWEAILGLQPGQFAERSAELFRAGSIGAISEIEFRRGLVETFNLTPAQLDDLLTDLWTEYLGQLNQELVAYFRGLRPRYRTAILSNSFIGAREKEQLRYGMDDMADLIIYSHEVHICKPDPAIYLLTCQRVGVPTDETVFLDDVEVNVEAARGVGMHAVLFKNNAQAIAEIDGLLKGPVEARF
ncbi:MAG: HAD family phosphatase [Cyanobacteria bacterium SZAS LIN-2]|nr:HAD family phosphatase [Cyanobacteria bacterium SZAS LIN-3]MBS1996916.1 HAD family phosphatase [Cyanobacteria bacterium SZAS LIN-2]